MARDDTGKGSQGEAENSITDVGPITQGLRQAIFSQISATSTLLYSVTRLGVYEELTQRWTSDNEGCVPALVTKIGAGLIAGGVGTAAVNAAVKLQREGQLVSSAGSTLLKQKLSFAAGCLGDAAGRIIGWRMRTQKPDLRTGLGELPIKEEATNSSRLWRPGSSLTVQRAMLVSGLQLATYDQAKESIMQSELVPTGYATHALAGGAAGLVTALVSNPIDIIKGRLTNARGPNTSTQLAYKGPLDCTLKIMRMEGPLVLYKGFSRVVMRQVPCMVMLFVSLEHVRYLLSCYASNL